MRRFCSTPLRQLALALVTVAGAHAQAPDGRIVSVPADSVRQRVAAEVTVPSGFTMTLFAAPPEVTYPTCLEPGGRDALFVCTDPNLIFGRERQRGRILRFVDANGDGVADRYTTFADSLDTPRGLVFDGETLYVMHPPTLSALRDTDGDGVADREDVLVEGLGFSLDDRGGDHTSNGLTLGIDGWIYIAVGDYGFLGATGRDGTQLRLRGGGVVRVRPDGSELEIVARGTRNIYDLGIDPFLRIFARDNTNNGQGWNSRLHYLPTGVDAGYPSLFRNFPDEIHPPLADYGAGAATTALWIEDPAFPVGPSGGLFTADWALNRVYHHPLSPRGATFDAAQAEFMEIPRPADMEVDGSSNLYVVSLSGGSYDYSGEHVGYVIKLAPSDAPLTPWADPSDLDEAELIRRILGSAAVRRLAAQRELLRRGITPAGLRTLEGALLNDSHGIGARVAALFTLKQLLGQGAHPALLGAVADPELRAMALRALADRRGELADVPPELFERSLTDGDPFVRLQAVIGLARLGSSGAAEHLLRAASSPDRLSAHVARNALVQMAAIEPALSAAASESAAEREAALHVLARLHFPAVVASLAARAAGASEAEPRRELLGALARLYHREGMWSGEWWGNQPNTEGPYFAPVAWEESVRIRPLLAEALVEAGARDLPRLLEMLVREGVLPRRSVAVFELAGQELREELVNALLGARELRREALPLLEKLAATDAELSAAVMRMLVAAPVPVQGSEAMIRAAALDRTLPVELRAEALTALERIPGAQAAAVSAATHAELALGLAGDPALLPAWRRFVNDRRRVAELDSYAALAERGNAGERVTAFAVLIQISGTVRNPEEARARAASVIERAWSDPDAAASLVRAIALSGAEGRFAERLSSHPDGSR